MCLCLRLCLCLRVRVRVDGVMALFLTDACGHVTGKLKVGVSEGTKKKYVEDKRRRSEVKQGRRSSKKSLDF